jgi:hypothetical protein
MSMAGSIDWPTGTAGREMMVFLNRGTAEDPILTPQPGHYQTRTF